MTRGVAFFQVLQSLGFQKLVKIDAYILDASSFLTGIESWTQLLTMTSLSMTCMLSIRLQKYRLVPLQV